MPGKAKKAQLHTAKMERKRSLKRSNNYLKSGPKDVISSATSPVTRKAVRTQSGFGTLKKNSGGYSPKKLHRGGPQPITRVEYKDLLRAEAKTRQDKRAARTSVQQLELIAQREGLSMTGAQFLGLKEVKRLMINS
jgi:hypothetical protein